MTTMTGSAAAEAARLRELHSYGVLDSAAERDFDDIAVLAGQVCATPIALVTLVDEDRQWFKAHVGLPVCQTSRDSSFCAHAIHGDGILEVPDALLDARFADNPLVLGDPHIRFYAGAPLVTPSGHALGSLCVIDRVPRRLSDAQRDALLILARHVVAELELRRYAHAVTTVNARLQAADRLKDDFLARITHELRTPMTTINGYLEMLADGGLDGEATAQAMAVIRRSSTRLTSLVEDMLVAAQFSTTGMALHIAPLNLSALAHAAVTANAPLAQARGLSLQVQTAGPVPAAGDHARLSQALDRLVLNAIKFTPAGSVTVRAMLDDFDHPALEVSDTGIGIPLEDQHTVLLPFRRTRAVEDQQITGAGLGLSIVKAVVDAHDGELSIDSAPGVGTSIRLTLPAPHPSATSWQQPSTSVAPPR